MVMDLPSPQNVGREFVRQYYTMLHEAPDYLYRFYSHNSSFLHGGIDHVDEEQLPAVGQSEINKRISSLKFQDCHAKIRQVDSQWSIGGSVVIQVVGELSNNGLPMRRFTQTFVLGQQNPKKYYVHNDIFRYQDEVFAEPGVENEIANEAGDVKVLERIEEAHNASGAQENDSANVYYGDESEASQVPVNPVSNGTPVDIEVAEESTSKPTEMIEALVNMEPPLPPPAVEADEQVKVEGELVVDAVVVDGGLEEIAVTKKDVEDEIEEQLIQESEITAVPQKPTWAAMASKNPNTPVAANASGATGAGVYGPKPQAAIRPEMKTENSSAGGLPQRTPRVPKTEPVVQENYRSGVDPGDETGRSIGMQYPDNQQVFVGNLPRNLADKDLREFFEKYGEVLDMRINRKPNNNNLPNFGFVVFDSPKTVERVLGERPLMFNGKHRVNVEEKKPREELVAARPRSATHIVGKPIAGRGAELNPAGRGPGRQNAPGPGGARNYAKGALNDENKPTTR